MAGKRIHGGTTVSGTMVLAHLAGIKVFGTGGLGGFPVWTGTVRRADIARWCTSRRRNLNGHFR